MISLSRRRFASGLTASGLVVPASCLAQSVPGRGQLDAAAARSRLPPIGAVERVVVWGYGTPPQRATRDLFVNETVVEDETVETPRDAALHLKFADGTSFRLGSQSKAVLDRFVYEPARGRGEMALELGRGSFRFISGRMDKSRYVLTTPTATIGLRGTDFVVENLADGTTVVTVLSGAVVLGRNVVVGPDEQGIARGGEPVVVRRRPLLERAIRDAGLEDRGASNDGGGSGGGSGGGGSGGGGQGGGGSNRN